MSASTEDLINQLLVQQALSGGPSAFGVNAPPDPNKVQALLQQLKQRQFVEQQSQPTGGEYGYLHDAGRAGFTQVGQQLGQAIGTAANTPPQPQSTPTPTSAANDAILKAKQAYGAMINANVDPDVAKITSLKMLASAGLPGADEALSKAQTEALKNRATNAEASKNTEQAASYANTDARDRAKEARETNQNTWTTLSGNPDDPKNLSAIVQRNGLGEVRVQQKVPGTVQAAANISPDAMQAMLDSYHTTGVVPAGLARSPIMAGKFWDAEAQYQASTGNNAASVLAQRESAKADGSALAQTQKQFAATSVYVNTFDKNIDKARQIGNALDFGDVQKINAARQAWLKGTSNPEYARYNLFFNAVASEFAKIQSGSLGNAPVTDAARKHADEVMSETLGNGGMNALFDAMKDESQNKLSSLQETRQSLIDRLSRRPGTPTPAAAPTPQAQAQQPPAPQTVPPRNPAATLPPARNANGWTLKRDARGNMAYVSPDGKNYQEVSQ